jgi:flagellar hook-associated protein 1 FlgK
MSNLLNVASRALMANQTALSTTGQNISNANTVGYSRQSAVLQSVPGQYTGSGYIGKGVEVADITRSHNEFLARQATQSQSVAAMDSTRADRLSALEDVFPSGTSGLGAAVGDMLNAFSDVASAPNDISARNVVLSRADEMASRFTNAQTQLDDLQRGVNSGLADSVKSINSLASRVASLNEQIARSQGSGHAPNDLLDQRDQTVRDLGAQVQVSTVAADDGSLNVFIGSQALVLGASTSKMTLQTAEGGTSTLAIERGTLSSPVDESILSGGKVAGLLRFQNSDLMSTRDGLGRLALAVTTEVNAQNRLGVDLDGQAGTGLFRDIAVPNAIAGLANTGNAVVAASVSDASALVASSYQIKFGAAGAFEVTRLSDGKATSFAGPMPAVIDGLKLDVASGAAAAGDTFTLKPYAAAAGAMGVALTSPRELAAASPVEARPAATNTGSVAIGTLAATSPNANLTAPVTLTFNANGTFDVAGTGTGNPSGVAYTSGQPININGWTLSLSGTPKAGDTVTVQATTAGYTTLNAGNANAVLALRDKAVFDGAPMVDGYAGLIAQIGVRSQSAQYAADVSGSIATSTETARANQDGVNLDEEAANLLQYQQAYQASAKMIQVAQNMFDTLLQNMR